jgi:formylmethanofuran dehydrogenase subunit A
VSIRLRGGRVYDPANHIAGQERDLYIRDGRIAEGPDPHESVESEYDVSGKIVMAGAIDMHTHIGGGKVNVARSLLPEDHRGSPTQRTDLTRSGSGYAVPSTMKTGVCYAEMGYTTCFEPALLPANARQAHMEMGDSCIIDKGGYALLGSDDFLLRMLAGRQDQKAINDYVAWTMRAAQCIGIKVVNPGGISAFKFNQRKLDLDDEHSYYRITPRRILQALARATHELGVPHPLHVHASNLGVAGNVETTLETIRAAEGLPLHLTHIQFHSYGNEGEHKFSSGAARLAEAINASPNISVDVGQIMFGQTVTASADTMAQQRNARYASPDKWVVMDIECDAGCGVVPFRYRDRNFINALQWAIGLELFLLVQDPWRVFLTTDHPNGAPFTSYPHLIRLLMDRTFRNEKLAQIHPEAAAMSTLGGIEREYSLEEIAVMTRAAPAKILGLEDRGHLAPGASADIVVYADNADQEAMFSRPELVFKGGELVVRNGAVVQIPWGDVHVVRPQFDASIERQIKPYFERFHSMRMENFILGDDEMAEIGNGARLVVHPCR